LKYGAAIFNEYRLKCPEVILELELNNQRVDLLEERFELVIRAGKLEDSM